MLKVKKNIIRVKSECYASEDLRVAVACTAEVIAHVGPFLQRYQATLHLI